MKKYGVSQEELSRQAWANTKESNPCTLATMLEVLRSLCAEKNGGELPADVEEMLDNLDCDIYVLSNSDRLNGAVYMCDKGTLEAVGDKLGCSFSIIPSSIHECIIIPDRLGTSMDTLKDMVEQVNETEVPSDEVLSGNVYKYDAQSHELSVYTGQNVGMSMGEGM